MTRKLFFSIAVVCLLAHHASAVPNPNPLIGGDLLGGLLAPVTGIVNTVTGTVGQLTNVVSDTLGTLTNLTNTLTSTLTKTVEQLLGTVLGLVETLLETLTKTLATVTETLGKTLESALAIPLDIVTGLLDSVTSSLNPSNLSGGLTSALKPILSAVSGIVKKVKGAVGCLITSVTGAITKEILKGVLDVLKCASPIVKTVTNATQLVSALVGGTLNVATGTVQNISSCATKKLTVPPNVGEIIGCLIGPVGQGLSQVTGVVGSATPIITDALNNALGVPQCAQRVLTNGLSKATAIVTDLVNCAAGKGVSATVPDLPSVVPNFTAIANKALATIQEITNNAVGPNSPLSSLMGSIKRLQSVVQKISPISVQSSVNVSVKGIQDAIDAIKNTASGSSKPEVKACIDVAQKVVLELSPQAAQNITTCVATVGPTAATLISQVATLDVNLKTEVAKAGVNAFTKCSGFALALDNAAQNCLDAAVAEVKNYIVDQLKQVNDAIQTANSLAEKAEKCLSNGLGQLDKAGQAIISQLKQCLSSQGVNTTTENITAALVAGKAAIDKAVANSTVTLKLITTINENIGGSLDFLRTIDSTIVQSVVAPTVDQASEALDKIEIGLKNETNPEVKVCIDDSRRRVAQLQISATQSATECIENGKAKVNELNARAKAEEEAIKRRVANASVTAEAQCKVSVSSSAAATCFANFQSALNVDVAETSQRMQNLDSQVKVFVEDTINCVNNAAPQVSAKVDDELAVIKTCLAAQGVDINIIRS